MIEVQQTATIHSGCSLCLVHGDEAGIIQVSSVQQLWRKKKKTSPPKRYIVQKPWRKRPPVIYAMQNATNLVAPVTMNRAAWFYQFGLTWADIRSASAHFCMLLLLIRILSSLSVYQPGIEMMRHASQLFSHCEKVRRLMLEVLYKIIMFIINFTTGSALPQLSRCPFSNFPENWMNKGKWNSSLWLTNHLHVSVECVSCVDAACLSFHMIAAFLTICISNSHLNCFSRGT